MPMKGLSHKVYRGALLFNISRPASDIHQRQRAKLILRLLLNYKYNRYYFHCTLMLVINAVDWTTITMKLQLYGYAKTTIAINRPTYIRIIIQLTNCICINAIDNV